MLPSVHGLINDPLFLGTVSKTTTQHSSYVEISTGSPSYRTDFGYYKENSPKNVLCNANGEVKYFLSKPAHFDDKLNGLKALLIEEFLDLRVKSNQQYSAPFRAMALSSFNNIKPNPEFMGQAIKIKEIAYLYFVNGKVQSVVMHADWVAKMNRANAGNEIVIDFGGKYYERVTETFNLMSFPEESFVTVTQSAG